MYVDKRKLQYTWVERISSYRSMNVRQCTCIFQEALLQSAYTARSYTFLPAFRQNHSVFTFTRINASGLSSKRLVVFVYTRPIFPTRDRCYPRERCHYIREILTEKERERERERVVKNNFNFIRPVKTRSHSVRLALGSLYSTYQCTAKSAKLSGIRYELIRFQAAAVNSVRSYENEKRKYLVAC